MGGSGCLSGIALLVVGLAASFAAAGPSTIPSWTGEANQANAHFGYSVATAGDVNGDGWSDVIVGARDYDAGQPNEGRALVYHGSATGLSLVADWTTESDQTLAFLGSSVAAAGDVNGDGYGDVIVGAPSWDGAFPNAGRALVFLGSASGLDSIPAWTKEGDQAGATFGNAVATAGDVNGDGWDDVIVGARGYDGLANAAGRAYVFLGSPTGPDTNAVWWTEVDQENAALGGAVGTAGDVNGDGRDDVIVGAFFFDGDQTDEGAAWVWLGSPGGLEATAVWGAEGNQDGAGFGWSVGPAGDVNGDGFADVIVGARYHDVVFPGEGRAYVFSGNATGVDSTATWFADGDETNAYFGWSVATAGDVNGDGFADVIVGAYRADEIWADAGRAVVHLGSAAGLAPTRVWTVGGAQATAYLGWSVGAAGDVDGDGYGDVIVGAHFDDDGQPDEGRAFVYRGGAEPPAPSAWRGTGGASAVSYGIGVASAGDVNGDGTTDVACADPVFSGGMPGEGRVDVFLGSESGPDSGPEWTETGGEASAAFGRSAAGAGDVNGDGFDDLIVGAPFDDGVFVDEGRAALYLGGASGLAGAPAWTGTGASAFSFFGFSVDGAGDVDGDGFLDVVVGASGHDGATADAGAVLLHLGSAGGLSASADLVREGTQSGARFGYAVAGAGDVNGDGYSDVMIGEPVASNGEAEEGRAHLYLGTSSGLAPGAAWTAEGDQVGARFGEGVAAAGDVDGDGWADVLVTARLFDGDEVDEGRAYLYRGSATGLAASSAWAVGSGQAGAQVASARAAGDVNGDGYDDVIVGAPLFTGTASQEGKVSLYLGSASGLASTPAHELLGGVAFARLGTSIAGRVDVDGDGDPEILVGAPGYADSISSGGAAFLHLGNGGRGAFRATRQLREDGTAPVARLGFSESESGFRLETFGRSAAGRSQVALEWEVRRLGVSFGEEGTVVGAWVDPGAPVPGFGSRLLLSALPGGLAASTPYRWRVRLRGRSPFFPTGPWRSLPESGLSETDLRTHAPPSGVSPAGRPAGALRLVASPTPFQTATTVRFRLGRRAAVRLTVHDAGGREVEVLHDAVLPAGTHLSSWEGRDARGRRVASGVYFMRLVALGETRSAKVVLRR